MSFKTDYSRVHGWGAAHQGVYHFWAQRITAIGLIPLVIFFIFPFAHALGGGYEKVLATYRNGWNAFIAIDIVIIVFWHLKLGLQVIIEDYAQSRRWRLTLLLANVMLTWSFAVVGVLAIAKIAFSA